MGMTINWGSILNKVNGYMNSPQGQKMLSGSSVYLDQAMAITEAAGQKMAEMVNSGMEATGVLQGSSASVGSVQMVGDGKFRATVDIQSEPSPSLYPAKYGGVVNIAKHLNNGWSAARQVWGYWPGHGYAGSRTTFGGYHFVSSAVASFPKAQYHVTNIQINNDWE